MGGRNFLAFVGFPYEARTPAAPKQGDAPKGPTMTNPYQRYNQVAAAAPVSHRSLEATALFNMARDLEAVAKNWDRLAETLDPVLEKNRMLWTFLATEVSENTALPDEIKQNILNLALFVLKRTTLMIANPSAQGLDALININRTLAVGLSSEQEKD